MTKPWSFPTPCLKILLVTLTTLVIGHRSCKAQLDTAASNALIQRILPHDKSHFRVGYCPSRMGKDVFELESRNGKILLLGNNGVAVASALYFYLTHFAHCQVTWNGTNLHLPHPLPMISGTIIRKTPFQYRYYLNYCTFNYSMSWWHWNRWQKEIDWMALHGINMPLALTGEEYTWWLVYKKMGFVDQQLKDFFCGPAYFSWFWMGNLDGWGGPLPLAWMKKHAQLESKILHRERSLGMTPVLPAFSGHVPAAFKQKFPGAKLKAVNWHNGFGDTYILDPADSLFTVLGTEFLQTQTRLFGTDHLYSADTYNENTPPSSDSTGLSRLSARIYAGMHDFDPKATWVMQGWLFYNNPRFWKPTQIEALLNAVPNNKMILLDLATEIQPIWKSTQAFYGKPWIWNMLNNFGGNVNLFGRMEVVAKDPALALQDPASKKMVGIGLTMEAIGQNPVLYELMMDHTWKSTPIDLNTWLSRYAWDRYGTDDPRLVQAWQILRHTVYNGKILRDGAASIIVGRPTLNPSATHTATRLNYSPKDLLPAWDLFLQVAGSHEIHSPGFRFDLVDVTRQVLANYASVLQQKWVKAFKEHNQSAFTLYSRQFLNLISNLDTLVGTNQDFLLGPWLESAESWGQTPAQKQLYERNARDLLTLWGDQNSPLHEYANRQWSGLLNNFYKKRWEKFFILLHTSLQKGNPPDLKTFNLDIRKWEWHWVNEQKSFPLLPSGNSIQVAQRMYQIYRKAIARS
ncbi:MAG: alpha-N-acetylglucosaminidase [Chitinophagaceae bacterium]